MDELEYSSDGDGLFTRSLASNEIDAEYQKLFLHSTRPSSFSSITHSSNLTELTIISQNVLNLDFLGKLSNLRILWLCECGIERLEKFDKNPKLEKLYLSDNRISSFDNLASLNNLKVLWLDSNHIMSLSGLCYNTKLEELNLSCNKVVSIGHYLQRNNELKILDLSGNPFYDHIDAMNLIYLPKLNNLSWNGSGVCRNFLCSNPNFTLFVIYNLPRLVSLDKVDISSNYFKSFINNVVKAKQLFYMCRIQSQLSEYEYNMNMLDHIQSSIFRMITGRIRLMDRTYKLMSMRKSSFSPAATVQYGCVNSRVKFWKNLFLEYREHFSDVRIDEKAKSNLFVELCQLELESCGYIQISKFLKIPLWYHDFCVVVTSRYCSHHFETKNPPSLQICCIHRILNRSLMEHFKKATRYDISCDFQFDSYSHQSCSLDEDFLFMFRSTDLDETELYIDIIRSGLQKCKHQPKFTRNLLMIDESYVKKLLESNRDDPVDRSLIVLVFRANMNDCNIKVSQTYKSPFTKSLGLHDLLNDNQGDHFEQQELDRQCCDDMNTVYEFNDVSKLYPEFIMIYKYVVNEKSVSFSEKDYATYFDNSSSLNAEIKRDKIVLDAIPPEYLSPYPSESSITASDLSLTIIGMHLPSLLCLNKLNNLTNVSLNHCQLIRLPRIVNSSIICLDISFNKITSLDGLVSLERLEKLDVSYNCLSHFMLELTSIAKSCPNILKLSMQCNRVPYPDNHMECISSLLNRLTHFDDTKVVKNSGKFEVFDVNDPNQFSKVGAIDSPEFPTPYLLTLTSQARFVTKTSPENLSHSLKREHELTHLCLRACKLKKLTGIEKLVNLRYLDIDENDINSLDDIKSCFNLVELSAEHNSISSLVSISGLTSIERLLLGSNCIQTLPKKALSCLQRLKTLTLRSNKLDTLDGIDGCGSLEELYIGNNRLRDLKNILSLFQLENLINLDLTRNPLTHVLSDYRLRLIFLVKCLRVLDGYEITNQEVSTARDMLHGHLSVEYLIEKLSTDDFSHVSHLDLSSSEFKIVDMMSAHLFCNLTSVNLENNGLTHFGGLSLLAQLKVLCLNGNKIESLFPSQKDFSDPFHMCDPKLKEIFGQLMSSNEPIFPNLSVLCLAQNAIQNLTPFRFSLMPKLRSIFLQQNELYSLTGLSGLVELKNLVLDDNKVVNANEIVKLELPSLTELHVENNRLKNLSALSKLEAVSRLYVGGNKITALSEVEEFASNAKGLSEISLINNPVTSKQAHRYILINGIVELASIDGEPVTVQERERVAEFFIRQELMDPLNQFSQSTNFREFESSDLKKTPHSDYVVKGMAKNKHRNLSISEQQQSSNNLSFSGYLRIQCMDSGNRQILSREPASPSPNDFIQPTVAFQPHFISSRFPLTSKDILSALSIRPMNIGTADQNDSSRFRDKVVRKSRSNYPSNQPRL